MSPAFDLMKLPQGGPMGSLFSTAGSMSPAFDLMKLPQGGHMGSLKMSIVVGAAVLPMDTPSSRTRSSTASGGGGADVMEDDGDDVSHGRPMTRATPPRM